MKYTNKIYRLILIIALLYIGLDGIIISYISCLHNTPSNAPKTEYCIAGHHHHQHEEHKVVNSTANLYTFYPLVLHKIKHKNFSVPATYTPLIWQPPKL